ncbi:MAG: prepilin-type N-terminal cleavage/methylation domain-containing protein [Verrucomicrobiales bacterium]|jgi:uncharacterized protein (TIGR02598 family)|nr:prepilin-type N-terminal cleavage/methylation domain-containing protein [Verrucomicrobiales bacterium]
MFSGNNNRNGRREHGFSLVEVVLAIGIMAFGLIVIIGLLPIGIKSNRDSTEESQAVNIMQAVIADRQGTDYTLNSAVYQIPMISGSSANFPTSGTFGITDSGSTTALSTSGTTIARYAVVYTLYSGSQAAAVIPNNQSPVSAVMNIRVSWPATQQTNQSSAVETTAVFLQP